MRLWCALKMAGRAGRGRASWLRDVQMCEMPRQSLAALGALDNLKKREPYQCVLNVRDFCECCERHCLVAHHTNLIHTSSRPVFVFPQRMSTTSEGWSSTAGGGDTTGTGPSIWSELEALQAQELATEYIATKALCVGKCSIGCGRLCTRLSTTELRQRGALAQQHAQLSQLTRLMHHLEQQVDGGG